MGFFTKEKYSYWQCSVDNKICTVSMIAMDAEKLDKELNEAIENVQKFEKEKSDLQSQRKNAKDNEEVSKINRKILDVESQYRTVYANGKTLEDKIGYYKRYNSIVYEVMRLKDIYTREEAVRIQIINNGIVDGCIITATNKIGEDMLLSVSNDESAETSSIEHEAASAVKEYNPEIMYEIFNVIKIDYIENE